MSIERNAVFSLWEFPQDTLAWWAGPCVVVWRQAAGVWCPVDHLATAYPSVFTSGNNNGHNNSTNISLYCIVLYCIVLYSRVCVSGGQGGEGAERERERIPSRFHAQHGAQHGAQSHDSKIMTWTKIKSQMLNWATQEPYNSTNLGEHKNYIHYYVWSTQNITWHMVSIQRYSHVIQLYGIIARMYDYSDK